MVGRAPDRLLHLAALLVPAARRRSWLRQWQAELAHRRRKLDDPRASRSPGELRWALGAIRHALWLRLRAWAPDGSLSQDVRFAARSLRRAPRYTALAAGVLAVGIAANAVIFSVVDATLLRPLPYPDSDRLVLIWQVNHEWLRSDDPFLADFGRSFPVSFPLYERWRERTDAVFGDLVAFKTAQLAVRGSEFPERVWGAAMAGNGLDLAGVAPLHGRGLGPADDRPGSDRVAVVGNGLWRRQFGGDPDLVGASIVIGATEYRVVGIMPPGFAFPYGRSELWINMPESIREGGWEEQGLGVTARLRPGVGLEAARARMATLTEALRRERPDVGDVGVRVTPLQEELVADLRPSLMMLLGAVALVLVIAAANVANLTLIRGVTRRRELALRMALGAGRGRLLRQLVAESTLLSLLGAALAVPLTVWSVGPVSRLLPAAGEPLELGVDLSVLAYATGLAAVSGILVGMIPGIRAVRGASSVSHRPEDRVTGGRGRSRALDGLAVAEIALAVVLLVGATLLLVSFERLAAVEHGLDARDLLTMDVDLPEATYPEALDLREYVDATVGRLRRLPEIGAAAMTSTLAFSGSESSTTVTAEAGTTLETRQEQVSPGYFEAMGIPVLRGRPFGAGDDHVGASVAVVNETAARLLWPDRDPLGQRLEKAASGSGRSTVVGIVADAHHKGLDRSVRPAVYFPLAQRPARTLSLVLRTTTAPLDAVQPVREALAEIDAAIPAADVRTMQERIDASTAGPRLRTALVSVMAALAAGLALLGVYGVIAYGVQARAREIGVRMALGAARGQVTAAVVGRGIRLALLGGALGLAGAALAGRILQSFLFGLHAWAPGAYALPALALLAAAAAASWIPARRAARVDPAATLRSD